MKRLWMIGAMLVLTAAAWADESNAPTANPRVKMKTTLGDVVLELDAEKAPISVANFLRYADDGFYNGTVFHRVMSNFMIQGGGLTKDLDKKTEGMHPPIKNEWRNGLKNVTGTIAMARTNAPDSATSQFFINVVDNPALDTPRGGAAYAVFGRVVEGMDTVEKIRYTEVDTNEKYPGGKVVPTVPVVIESVTVVNEFDRKKLDQRVATAEEAAKVAAEAAAKARAESQRKQGEMVEKTKVEQKKLAAEAIKKAEEELGAKAVTTPSGLTYIDMTVGEGASPSPTSRVQVHYTGWLLDGTKFDSSVDRGKPSAFPLNGVIKGWTEGVGSMKVGGKRKLFVPSDLAYGDIGRPSIPPGATLIFDVELLNILQ